MASCKSRQAHILMILPVTFVLLLWVLLVAPMVMPSVTETHDWNLNALYANGYVNDTKIEGNNSCYYGYLIVIFNQNETRRDEYKKLYINCSNDYNTTETKTNEMVGKPFKFYYNRSNIDDNRTELANDTYLVWVLAMIIVTIILLTFFITLLSLYFIHYDDNINIKGGGCYYV